MRSKSCITCEHFVYSSKEQSPDRYNTLLFKDPVCMHELSEGKPTEVMLSGVCGKDHKLWERRKREKES